MAKLILTLNGSVINQYFIDKACVSIGRDASNDIAIDDPLLSREHARVLSVGKDQIVEDLKSSNGTLINGTPLVRQILQHSDVIELGSHHLRYMSARVAADVELERTMLINALPRNRELAGDAPVVAVPAARAGRLRLPNGSVRMLAGPGPRAIGESVRLDRVVTIFGIPGEQLIVIARRPQGYFLTHVEGAEQTRVNRTPIGAAPRCLCDGDVIEAAACRLEFALDPPVPVSVAD